MNLKTLGATTLAAVLAFGSVGCAEQEQAAPASLLSLSLHVAQPTATAEDPFTGVSFMRLALSDESGTIMDKFVHYEDGGNAPLDLPFGDGLQLTIEGWSMNAGTGLIGDLVSRGRTTRFSLSPDSEPLSLTMVFARVNEFSQTTTAGPGGPAPSSLNVGRVGHTVTALDDGRALIVGGAQLASAKTSDVTGPADLATIFDSVEIYDPKTGEFSLGPSMGNPRAFHTATKLPDGRVLIGGGLTEINGAKQTLTTLQIFDPATNAFEPVGTGTITARAAHTAVLLDAQGHIMFAGGFGVDTGGTKATLASVEVYCAAGFSCAPAEGVVYSTNMSATRAFHTATRVPVGDPAVDGVVVMGGEGEDGVRSSMETFMLNPAGFTGEVVDMTSGPRTRHTATYVPSQRFLHVVGGFSDGARTLPVQRIDSLQVSTGQFQGVQEFFALHARGGHTATLMPGNAILVVGGFDATGPLATAEVVFEYRSQEDGKTYIDRGGVESMGAARGGARAVLLPNDTVLMVGGVLASGAPNTVGEFFNPL